MSTLAVAPTLLAALPLPAGTVLPPHPPVAAGFPAQAG
jgi:hypothetical protein